MKQHARQRDEAPLIHSLTSTDVPDVIDTATLHLLESWRIQDATEDPEKLRTAERELAEFKRAMNENRTLTGEPLLYP